MHALTFAEIVPRKSNAELLLATRCHFWYQPQEARHEKTLSWACLKCLAEKVKQRPYTVGILKE